jgi:hypothetical protein
MKLFTMEKDLSKINCPVCKKGIFSERITKKGDDMLVCGNCDKKIYKYKDIISEVGLNNFISVLKNSCTFVPFLNKYLHLKESGGFINIYKSDKPINDKDEYWMNILPIFPIVCSTNNSITGIIKGENKKDTFDFMLIDEAATILASKMIVLHLAKRGMLFGDEKQLKPVYPYDSSTELGILRTINNKDSIVNYINNSFSCSSGENTSNNGISIANNATKFYFPYDYSKLEGDIWLKEHFRCLSNIGAISNELTYFDEMILLSGSGGILSFIETNNS